MNTETSHNAPPITVTSKTPGHDKVRLDRALQLLTETVLASVEECDKAIDATEALERFGRSNVRYANQSQLSKISSPNALKAWAAERLPSLGISYGFSNRITREISEQTMDERASLEIVRFADDLTMIARFCRAVSELSIEVLAHSHGIEFRFFIKGEPLDERFEEAERNSFQELLKTSAHSGSFRNRIISTRDRIEAQSILFRKKVRLGISPGPLF